MTGLPRGWAARRLGDLIDGFEAGRNLRAEGRPASEGEFGVLKISAVSWGRFQPTENKALLQGDSPKPHETIKQGDLLISRANTTELVGAVAMVDADYPQLMLPDKVLRLKVRRDAVEPGFLLQALRLPEVRAYLEANATGTSDSMRNLSQPKLEATPLVVPPLNEQRRIVVKLEALQSRSRRAREALDAVPPLLEKLRQSILAAAFRGDLTKDWRAQNPNPEPAEALLARLRTERRHGWETSELAKLKSKGKPPTNDAWKAKYKEPEPVDTTNLPELPKGWCWASVDELSPGDAPSVYGIILPGDDVPGGVPYVRPVDMRSDGTIDIASLKRTSVEIAAQYERARLRTGDVVLSIVGTIGKVIVVPSELDGGNITQSSARIRPPKTMSSEYLSHALLSPQLVNQYDSLRFGNAVQRLNVEDVRALAIPLAPEAEQTEVVRRLQSALAAQPNGTMTKVAQRLAELNSAILAKAFRGELVPQDPNDEPADVTLSRVAATANTEPPRQRARRAKAAE